MLVKFTNWTEFEAFRLHLDTLLDLPRGNTVTYCAGNEHPTNGTVLTAVDERCPGELTDPLAKVTAAEQWDYCRNPLFNPKVTLAEVAAIVAKEDAAKAQRAAAENAEAENQL